MILRPKTNRVFLLPIDRIVPNPGQPRQYFKEEALTELAESIRCHGILQPLTVRQEGSVYELVAGERRLRAAKLAGLREVPCLLAQVDARESSLLALVENLQREDLHFLEEAAAMARLVEDYSLTQEEVARRLGKSPSAVANKLRLLRLSPACVVLLQEASLSERHARALLRIEDEEERLSVLRYIIKRELNVAQTDAYIESRLQSLQRTPPRGRTAYIIKDVRLFLNSVNRGLDIMRRSGVAAGVDRQDTEQEILLTIRIPKSVSK